MTLPFRSLTISITIAILLAGCDDKASHRAIHHAEREVAQALAHAGARLVERGAGNTGGNAAAAPDRPANVSTALVTGRNAVGHRDFEHAKAVLQRQIFTGTLQRDFYCGCGYDARKQVDLGSCGFVPRKDPRRAGRIEWEHIVTAWEIGHQRQCWQQGGRKACTTSDPIYRVAEGDLVNLVPAVGEVNGDRSNFPYSQWTSHPAPIYGACQTVVDFGLKRAQPRAEVRGHIARVFFYMHQRYGLGYSKQDQQLMCGWAASFPIDNWERERDRRILALQGAGNPLVEQPEEIKRFCG